MKPAAALALHDIRLAYGKVTVLDGVSFNLEPGGFLVLLGPSGCGKSTLLAAIAGLQPLAGGRVDLGGRDVTDMDPADRDIAMVFQSYALYPTMTVAQNLTFGLRMRGAGRDEIATKLASAAKLLRLDAFLDRRPAQLSGGQRQRVAIGRAMVRDPALFLFDEPMSNLDAELRVEMRTEIKRLQQAAGTTAVLVTHDQAEAMTMGTAIGVMQDGRILQMGAPGEIYDRPESLFVARFVGSPGMNIIHGHLARRKGGIAFEAGGLAVPLDHYAWRATPQDGRPVALGLRAEDIEPPDRPGTFAAIGVPVLLQPTGADILVRLELAKTEIMARLDRAHGVVVGQKLAVGLNLRRLSVFCAITEARL